MKALYGDNKSLYSIVVEEDERGHFSAKLYRGKTVVYSDVRPHRSAENACKKAIDNYIKEGFAEYHKYNSLVDAFMNEPQPKKNYWAEYRAKIKADELEKLKKIVERGY